MSTLLLRILTAMAGFNYFRAGVVGRWGIPIMNIKNMLEIFYFYKPQKSHIMLWFLKFIIDNLFSCLT